MSSTRLPGKVLLPICGMPVVVLAARRAANSGIETTIATSTESSDDPLAAALAEHGLACCRGPLTDVLARFVLATQDLDDDDICIRFTSDNVVPDGRFAAALVAGATRAAGGCAGMVGGSDGIPYGVAGEALRVGRIREAQAAATDPFDREHVTPWIIKRYGRAGIDLGVKPAIDMAGIRCTIDTPEDYQRVASTLQGIENPIHAPWLDLCYRFVLPPST